MEKDQAGRRDFLKTVTIGTVALWGGLRLPFAIAKDVYPSDRITWITNVKPGGGFDLIARLTGPYLTSYLRELSAGAQGGVIVIKNVTQGGGNRAFNNIFNAKPDGYTVGDFNTGYITDSITSDKKEFDWNNYTFLVRTSASVRLVVTRKDSFQSWDQMMSAGKAKELKFAVANFGRGHHVSAILLKEATNIPARLINFPGAVENANALLRGDVQLAMTSEEAGKPLIDSGAFRVLAVLAEKSPYPGVPSIAQLGFPELAPVLKLYRMVVAPPNLPKGITDIMVSAFQKVFEDKKFLVQAEKIGFVPEPLYGIDAQQEATKLLKYFNTKTALLKKHLQ